MAKTSISLVSVQKPTANTSPILQRRTRLTSNIELQIMKIGRFGGAADFAGMVLGCA